MSDLKVPRAPSGTGPSGRKLWAQVLGEYVLEEHEMALLREMVRTVDLLDELADLVRREGVMVPGPGLSRRIHPAAVEARQLRVTFARLTAALRLPEGVEGDEQQGARRPQRRSGARGVYSIRAVS